MQIKKYFIAERAGMLAQMLAIAVLILLCIRWASGHVLTIVVPGGYVGQVSLVLSNVEQNMLRADKNGICYISRRTFYRRHARPDVFDEAGISLNERCVGHSPAGFWASGAYSEASHGNKPRNEIKFLSFEIVPKNKKNIKQYYFTDLGALVDTTKLLR